MAGDKYRLSCQSINLGIHVIVVGDQRCEGTAYLHREFIEVANGRHIPDTAEESREVALPEPFHFTPF